MSQTDTREPTTTDPRRETLDRYLRFWNTPAAAEDDTAASGLFASDIRYCAPIGDLTGSQALADFRDQFFQHMQSAEFRARREPEIHHDRARLLWQIDVHGEEFATGTDVLTFAPDGRITTVTAFLDKAPEGFDPHTHG
ncbi:hypothetical protein GCM10009601_05850 [Streptomyces thermospinosisporus]|uniref:SnoaL-like domain-containing protein n=1 Tax=Streptomyces thermospinosisporus TaxID=161482 RepID=A0ABP4JBZ1_9ACTN